jgi:TRAP-type uncharacterized transport system fused permease subunit
VSFTAAAGVISLAGGLQGWFLAKTNVIERWILIFSGVCLAYPSSYSDIAGFAGFALVVLIQFIKNKKSAGAAA